MATKSIDLFRPLTWTATQRDKFLDEWWDVNDTLFEKYHEHTDGQGASMISLLKLKEPKLFASISQTVGLLALYNPTSQSDLTWKRSLENPDYSYVKPATRIRITQQISPKILPPVREEIPN